jgi:hypothetical protein
LSPLPKVRRRKWAEAAPRPFDEATLAAIRRSAATGLPYCDAAWVKRLAKRLDLDLIIRPRGRPTRSSPVGSASGFDPASTPSRPPIGGRSSILPTSG